MTGFGAGRGLAAVLTLCVTAEPLVTYHRVKDLFSWQERYPAERRRPLLGELGQDRGAARRPPPVVSNDHPSEGRGRDSK